MHVVGGEFAGPDDAVLVVVGLDGASAGGGGGAFGGQWDVCGDVGFPIGVVVGGEEVRVLVVGGGGGVAFLRDQVVGDDFSPLTLGLSKGEGDGRCRPRDEA